MTLHSTSAPDMPHPLIKCIQITATATTITITGNAKLLMR